MRLMGVRSMGRSCCGADVGQSYGAGATVGQIWVRSMGQEMVCGRCGSDLWCKSCCGADVGQIYGAGAAVGLMWVRSMAQELLLG